MPSHSNIPSAANPTVHQSLPSPQARCCCVSLRLAVLVLLAVLILVNSVFFAIARNNNSLVQFLTSVAGFLISGCMYFGAVRYKLAVYKFGVVAYILVGVVANAAFVAWVIVAGPQGLAEYAGKQSASNEDVERMAWTVVVASTAAGVVVQAGLAWVLVRYIPELRREIEEMSKAAGEYAVIV